MDINNKNYYDSIENRLAKILAKKIQNSILDIDHIKNETDLIDEYKDIIRSTINKYNYNGKNFNPAYLPVILAMALKEQEFKIVQDASWNNISKKRPTQKNENEILAENLNLVLNYIKNEYKDLTKHEKESGEILDSWDVGFNIGFETAISDLTEKIKEMTK